MQKQKAQIYYSSIHFFYWMAHATVCSFCSAFLLHNGYSSSEIGLILAMGYAGSILLQPCLAQFADRTRKFLLPDLLRAVFGIYLLLSGLVLVLQGRSIFLSVFYILVYVIHSSVVPLLNELNYYLEAAGNRMNYGAARAVGSFGYSIMSTAAGFAAEKAGYWTVPALTTVSAGMVLLLLCMHGKIADGRHRNPGAEPEKSGGMAGFVQEHPDSFLTAAGCGFLMFSTITTANYLLQIMENVGGTTKDMGFGLSLAAIAEIPVMFFYSRLSRRYSPGMMLKAAAIGYVIKQTILLSAGRCETVLFSQLFQMVSFALYLPASVAYAHETSTPHDSVKAQALFNAMSTGSGLLASLAGGFIIDRFGVRSLLILCLITSLLGMILIFLSARTGKKVCRR